MISRLRIRTKLVMCFLVVAALVPMLGTAALTRLNAVNDDVKRLTDDAIPRGDLVEQLRSTQYQQQAAIHSFFSGGNPVDKERFAEQGQHFDATLSELGKRDTSARGEQLAQQVTEQRKKFNFAARQIVRARETKDRNQTNLNAKQGEMVQQLNKIRGRFAPSAGSGAVDASSISTNVRYQVNDLLLSTEGMLHMVNRSLALVADYAAAPNEQVKRDYEQSRTQFNNWLQNGMNAGGPEDRAILRDVQAKYTEFEASARSTMNAADFNVTARVDFDDAATAVNASIASYAGTIAADVATQRSTSASAVADARGIIIFFAAAAFGIAGMLGFFFATMVTGPIMMLRDVANRVSTGDLDNVDIEVESKDEIGDLADAFRRMVASVRFLMTRDADADAADDDDFDFGIAKAS
ncbi:MAG: HAMP domain-containing protein [Dehalococcoidia bacterium]